MASFRRRKTGYQVRVTGYHPVTGKRFERTRTTNGTEDDLEKVARRMEDLKQRGELTYQHNQTLAKYLDKWLDAVRPSLAPETIRGGYTVNVRKHLTPHLVTSH